MSIDAPTLQLRDRNIQVVRAWAREFGTAPGVEITCGDIFDVTADAIVSPANSFGFMDGGIDLVYVQHFGWELQTRLQQVLRDEHHGELPVGQAVVVPTNDSAIPWLVSAPTMRVPGVVADSPNAYLAFRAALLAVRRHNERGDRPAIRSVLCPGLATAVGRMPPDRCARQMRLAWAIAVEGLKWPPGTPGEIVDAHFDLLK